MTPHTPAISEGYGRGFSHTNISQMRKFFLRWEIVQTVSEQSEARAKFSETSETRLETIERSARNFAVIFPLTSLPDEETLRHEIVVTRRALAMRGVADEKDVHE